MGGSRRHRARPVDGLLLLDKPAGMTSNRALQTVRRLLDAAKGGHTGALDPAATGLLPLCFGEATKVSAFLLDADKTYRVTARLGGRTDTGDADGTVVETAAVPEFDAARWQEVLDVFLGDSLQVPPMYSALKQGGRRLYELARQGEQVEREPRPICVHAIELLEIAGSRLVFRVRCSKGTYVRSLVEDIAASVGTVAHTARLHREALGPFGAADMLPLDAVEALAGEGREALAAKLLAPDAALVELPARQVNAAEARKFRHGQDLEGPAAARPGLVRVYGADAEFLGVGELDAAGRLRPRRVFLGGEKNP